MHPYIHAKTAPDRAAYIMVETGEIETYKQLDERSNQAAHLFREAGLQRGDSIVLYLENHARFLELCWAAQRSGLYYTPISSHLTESEVDYIIADVKPKLFFTSARLVETAARVESLVTGQITAYLVDDGNHRRFSDYVAVRDQHSTKPIFNK